MMRYARLSDFMDHSKLQSNGEILIVIKLLVWKYFIAYINVVSSLMYRIRIVVLFSWYYYNLRFFIFTNTLHVFN